MLAGSPQKSRAPGIGSIGKKEKKIRTVSTKNAIRIRTVKDAHRLQPNDRHEQIQGGKPSFGCRQSRSCGLVVGPPNASNGFAAYASRVLCRAGLVFCVYALEQRLRLTVIVVRGGDILHQQKTMLVQCECSGGRLTGALGHAHSCTHAEYFCSVQCTCCTQSYLGCTQTNEVKRQHKCTVFCSVLCLYPTFW